MPLYLTIILMPFVILGYGLVHTGHRVTLTFLAVAVLGSMAKVREIRYFCYIATSICIYAQAVAVYHGAPSTASIHSINAAHYIIMGMGVYLAATRANLETVANLICVSAIIQSVIGLCQQFGFYPYYFLMDFYCDVQRSNQIAPFGTLFNPNFLAGYLAISLAFFMRGKWVIPGGLIFFHILTMDTTGAVVAACAGVVAYFQTIPSAISAIIIAVVYVTLGDSTQTVTTHIATGGKSTGGSSDNSRYVWWMNVLKNTDIKSLLWGHGAGTRPITKCPVHNEWVSGFYQYGISVVILAASYIWRMRKQNRMLFAALVVIAVNCMANYPLHLAPSGVLIMAILGLLEKDRHGELQGAI